MKNCCIAEKVYGLFLKITIRSVKSFAKTNERPVIFVKSTERFGSFGRYMFLSFSKRSVIS